MYTQLQNLLTDPEQQQAMFEDLYRELKIIARSRMAGEGGIVTLNPTTLVHEAWIRLEKGSCEPWENRPHFCRA